VLCGLLLPLAAQEGERRTEDQDKTTAQDKGKCEVRAFILDRENREIDLGNTSVNLQVTALGTTVPRTLTMERVVGTGVEPKSRPRGNGLQEERRNGQAPERTQQQPVIGRHGGEVKTVDNYHVELVLTHVVEKPLERDRTDAEKLPDDRGIPKERDGALCETYFKVVVPGEVYWCGHASHEATQVPGRCAICNFDRTMQINLITADVAIRRDGLTSTARGFKLPYFGNMGWAGAQLEREFTELDCAIKSNDMTAVRTHARRVVSILENVPAMTDKPETNRARQEALTAARKLDTGGLTSEEASKCLDELRTKARRLKDDTYCPPKSDMEKPSDTEKTPYEDRK
jgi:hypothetical protein